jgi:sialic acid synthase SpsE
LVASRSIKAGEAFTAENLSVKRPGKGISPMRWDEAMNKKARKDYLVDEEVEF